MDYFITWHTYGTWLPGDERGWHSRKADVPMTSKSIAESIMKHDAVVLSDRQRGVIDRAIRDHCEHRGWKVHALNVRTNHVHLVVRSDREPEKVMGECKAWGTRRLREDGETPERVWARHGSTRYLTSERSFARAIEYVLQEQ